MWLCFSRCLKHFQDRKLPEWTSVELRELHRRRSLFVLVLRSEDSLKRANNSSPLKPTSLRALMPCKTLFSSFSLTHAELCDFHCIERYVSLFQACLRSWSFCVCKLYLQPLLWLQGPRLLPLWRQNQWYHMFVLRKPDSTCTSPGMPRSGSPSVAGRQRLYLPFWCWYTVSCSTSIFTWDLFNIMRRDLSLPMTLKSPALLLSWNCTTKMEAS